MNDPYYCVIHADFREQLSPIKAGVDTIFSDPPDNITLGYDEYDDNLGVEEYINFLNELMELSIGAAKTTYMSFNARYISEVGALIEAFKVVHPTLQFRFLIQGFTFGQHNKHDLANNFRPILRIRREDAPLFPDAVRIESERMRIGDKRANPEGRVPGDVWRSDFLEYARVVGNNKQRRAWHPTQLNEALVEDCLLMSTPPGGQVIDPFAGTGTTLRVCKANGWSCHTMDISREYCEKIAEEHNMLESKLGGIWT